MDTFLILILLSRAIQISSGNEEFLMDLSNQELNTENLKNIHFLEGITSLNLSHNVIDEITQHVFDGLSQVSISK